MGRAASASRTIGATLATNWTSIFSRLLKPASPDPRLEFYGAGPEAASGPGGEGGPNLSQSARTDGSSGSGPPTTSTSTTWAISADDRPT